MYIKGCRKGWATAVTQFTSSACSTATMKTKNNTIQYKTRWCNSNLDRRTRNINDQSSHQPLYHVFPIVSFYSASVEYNYDISYSNIVLSLKKNNEMENYWSRERKQVLLLAAFYRMTRLSEVIAKSLIPPKSMRFFVSLNTGLMFD